MKELSFATGLEAYTLKGVGTAEVQFNPTDAAFVERLFHVFDALDQKQADYDEARSAQADPRASFETARAYDGEMRALIDEAFDGPVSGPLFGGLNAYAMAGGLPIWANLMLTVMDEVGQRVVQEREEMNPRLKQYLDRWNKR